MSFPPILVYIVIVCFIISLFINIGLNLAFYWIDRASEDFIHVERAYLTVNILMFLLAIGFLVFIFAGTNICKYCLE